MGETPSLAARLRQSRAPPGAIVMAEATRRLLPTSCSSSTSLGKIRVKGFAAGDTGLAGDGRGRAVVTASKHGRPATSHPWWGASMSSAC